MPVVTEVASESQTKPEANTAPATKTVAETPDAKTDAQVYWLRYGLAGLYNKDGDWQRLLREAGPYKIIETQGDFARISAELDHWVRRVDLSTEPPLMRPDVKTGPPDRPVTQFPDALQEEAKRRGVELKGDIP